jgi:hypothetical protein
VGYRDDDEALRARVGSLESELADARAEIARLRAESPEDFGRSNALLGGPTQLGFERTIDRELDETELEEVVSTLRTQFGELGRLDRVGGTLTWATAFHPNQGGRRVEVTLERRRGVTRILVRERLGNVAGGLFGGIVGGLGGGGLGAVIPLSIVGGVAAPVVPLLALGWLGLTWSAVRLGYGALTRRRRDEHARLAARIDALVREGAPPVRARVAEEREVEAPRVHGRVDERIDEELVAEPPTKRERQA